MGKLFRSFDSTGGLGPELIIHRKPLITSHFPNHPPSYPSVCIDAFNHASLRHLAEPSSSKQVDIEPVLWVNTLSRAGGGAGMGVGMGGAGICHIQREGLRFLVPVGQEGEFFPSFLLFLPRSRSLCEAALVCDY